MAYRDYKRNVRVYWRGRLTAGARKLPECTVHCRFPGDDVGAGTAQVGFAGPSGT